MCEEMRRDLDAVRWRRPKDTPAEIRIRKAYLKIITENWDPLPVKNPFTRSVRRGLKGRWANSLLLFFAELNWF